MAFYSCVGQGKHKKSFGATLIVTCAIAGGLECELKLNDTVVQTAIFSEDGIAIFRNVLVIGTYTVSCVYNRETIDITDEDIAYKHTLNVLLKTPIYLYKNGDECSGITGGWTFNLNNWNKIESSKSGGRLRMAYMATSQGSSSSGCFSTNYGVGISDFTSLCVEYSCVGNASSYSVGTCVAYQSGISRNAKTKGIPKSSTTIITKIPVAEIISFPYICIWMSLSVATGVADDYINIYKVWLE